MSKIIVRHKQLGEGTLESIYGPHIEVRFDDVVKKFFFPNAFDNNTLETDDPGLIDKINQALQKVGRQYHGKSSIVAPQKGAAMVKRTDIVQLINNFSSSFIGKSSGFIEFQSDEDLFEVLGYLASPGRLAGIWAEIPNDHREAEFKRLFPGQTYMPISQTTTKGGKPAKFGPQFRINLADKTNCPKVLESAIGKGLGKAVVGRINRSKFVVQLVHFFGFQFGNTQDVEKIKKKVSKYGYEDAFNRGYNK